MLALAALLLAPPQPVPAKPAAKPVVLGRVFRAGEADRYRVTARLTAERKQPGLETTIPQDIDISYEFSLAVRSLKADGIAEVLYARPIFTVVEGESFGLPERKSVTKDKTRQILTLSPLNEILDSKEEKKAKWRTASGRRRQGDFLGQFVNELRRLALFVGPPSSALDFNPRFPLDPVKPGDTWKRTVGYSPQKLSGKESQAVQRLDYLYTYDGLVTVNGKPFRRVTATLDFTTDLGAFFNQLVEAKAEQTGLFKVPMTLKAKIEFNLDPKTNRTVSAFATSTGSYELFTTQDKDEPLFGEKMRGSTRMVTVPAPTKKR